MTKIYSDSQDNFIAGCISSSVIPGRKSFFAGLILVLFFLATCKKPEDIGLNTLPPDDLLYTAYSDTATLVTTTVREDTLRADELSRILIGSTRDAVLGLTQCSFYGQVLLSSTPNLIADSGATRVADSLVLSLAYSQAGWYGDTSALQTIHVYQLTEDMYLDSVYYSNKTFQTSAADLADHRTFQSDLSRQSAYAIRPTTPVVVGTDTNAAPQLRIRLSDALRDAVFGRNSQPEFANNDNWKSYFKGLHISVSPPAGNGGALLYFNPTSASTRMTLYYHEDTIPKSYSFTLSGGARLTHTSHDYSGSQVEAQLNDSAMQFDNNYLQPLAGLKTRVSFPHLKHFTDSGSILINKAELVISVPTGTVTANAPAPETLLLLAKNESGKYDFPIDYYERNFGGTYNATDQTYTFRITRTIQRILDGTTADYGFTLNILGSMVAGNGATIGSGISVNSPMKLKLYYTKLH